MLKPQFILISICSCLLFLKMFFNLHIRFFLLKRYSVLYVLQIKLVKVFLCLSSEILYYFIDYRQVIVRTFEGEMHCAHQVFFN